MPAGDPRPFFLGWQAILKRPAPTVVRGFMPAANDLASNVGTLVYGFTDHEARGLDAVPIEQIQQPENALVRAILVISVLGQIRHTLIDGHGDWSWRARDWLPAALELHRNRHGQACASGPKSSRRA
jgi:hypothetical protein